MSTTRSQRQRPSRRRMPMRGRRHAPGEVGSVGTSDEHAAGLLDGPAELHGRAGRPEEPRRPRRPRRRGRDGRMARAVRIAIPVMIVIVLGCIAAAGWATATAPSVATFTPHGATRERDVEAMLTLRNVGSVAAGDVRVSMNGSDVTDEVRITGGEDRVVVAMDDLADGPHALQVTVAGIGPLGRSVGARTDFTVDRTRPRIRIDQPEVRAGRAMRSDVRRATFVVRTEAGAVVTVRGGGNPVSEAADEDGRAQLKARLSEGRQMVHLAVRDKAGNERRRSFPAVVDSLAPVISLPLPRRVTTASPEVHAMVADAHDATVTVTNDGDAEEIVAANEDGSDRWTLTTEEPLREGRHVIAVAATDSFGNTRTAERIITVDSTEQIGDNALGRGARGRDVRDLHSQLRRSKVFDPTAGRARSEWAQQVYGVATRDAVKSWQAAHGIEADGVAGQDTIAAMTLRIVIDRATHKLTLYRIGRVEKVYNVAVGQAAYPTPAGVFSIQGMQENPTWTPPDSDWAKDAKVIPPGPNNPLGTRWMQVAGTVGIHGTNNPASIGYSVSHGCIRMAIPDVEDLYERVRVGTPVKIV